MRHRNILVIREGYFPFDPRVRKEVLALKESGFDVTVLCIGKRDEMKHEIWQGIKIVRVKLEHKRGKIMRYIYEYLFFFLIAFNRALKWHINKKFCIVQVNTLPDFLIFSVLPLKILGAKLVLDVHEPMAELWETLFKGKISKIVSLFVKIVSFLSFKVPNVILTVTSEMKTLVKKRGAGNKKIYVLHNLPNPRDFPKLEVEKKDDNFILVTHGSVEERYGLDNVLDALNLLKNEENNLRFWIIGEGSYLNELKDKAEELGIKHMVKFWGFLPFEQVIKLLNMSDAGIVPMKKNPYSDLIHTNKMYEFMLLEKPVIISKTNAVMRIFNENEVIYFEPGDAHSLAESIQKLVHDPSLSSKLVVNALRKVESLSWEVEKKNYLNCIFYLVEKGT